MTRILVTGAAGHLGRALTAALLRDQPFGMPTAIVAVDRQWAHRPAFYEPQGLMQPRSDPHSAARPGPDPTTRSSAFSGAVSGAVSEIVSRAVSDAHPEGLPGHRKSPYSPAITHLTLDLTSAAALDELASLRPGIVFHLAGITSRAAQADPSLGLAVNVTATLGLLERLATRAGPGDTAPVFIHASSIGVFGTPLPPRIDDETTPSPTLSYGTHKRMVELLLADHARRGRIDGRAVRLPSVVARPREASGALSSFASDLLREPAAGRPYTCPIGPEGTLWLLSTPACVAALIHAARLPAAALPASRCWTLPALRASAGDIVAALARRFGPEVADRVRWAPDPALTAQFANWPPLHTPLADALGFRHDGELDWLVERALGD